MRHIRIPLSLIAVLTLCACGTMMEGQTQKVQVITPGASESECILDNGVRVIAQGGETVTIQRNGNKMVVECYASGDRYRKIVLPPDMNAWSAGNVVTGIVPGMAYDHLAGGLYTYPDRIEIDFVGTPTRGYETPGYMNKDAPNPYAQAIEPYGAAEAKLPSDGSYLKRGLEKAGPTMGGNPFEGLRPSSSNAARNASPAPVIAAPSAAPASATGMNVTEQLTRSMNPSVFQR